MSLGDIHSVLLRVSHKIDKIETIVHGLNTKLCELEKRVSDMQITQQQPQTQIAMVTTISSSEEKIKMLNQQTKVGSQEDFVEALKARCVISDSGVHNILNQTITIYEYIVDIIYEFDNESPSKYIYGFADSKNNIYYWNQAKKTWAKMSKTYLQDLFMVIQNKIIIKYNNLLNKDKALKKGCVESGDLIYVDDFEKRHGDFKKSIISRFV